MKAMAPTAAAAATSAAPNRRRKVSVSPKRSPRMSSRMPSWSLFFFFFRMTIGPYSNNSCETLWTF